METIGFSFELYPLLFTIVFVVLCSITYMVLRINKKNYSTKQLFFLGSTIFYLLSVFKLTLLPIIIRFNKEAYPDVPWDYYYQLVPFKTILSAFEYGNDFQVFGNLLILLPLPILLGLLKNGASTFIKSLILVFTVSLSIELVQLVINFTTGVPNKVADIDDLILNTIGGVIGWFLIKLYLLIIKENRTSRRSVSN
ncbi:VanZ family protein [Metabacillus dongyingensis]|uniref:VanZ family protein n=1 Tax=Metabacillus dongyingensis TaxID=2874282 RepID=UPI003B8D51B9